MNDAKNYFQRVRVSYPEADAAHRFTMVSEGVCGHEHATQTDAEACDYGGPLTVEMPAEVPRWVRHADR